MKSLMRSATLFTGACLLGLSAHAADPTSASAGCNPNEARNDPAACQREAGAAKVEAQRGNLTSPGAAAQSNEADRCRALTGGEKTDCLSRVKGGGTSSTTTTSGSVNGGGIIQETTTTTVGPAR
jgi:hypothetical protein